MTEGIVKLKGMHFTEYKLYFNKVFLSKKKSSSSCNLTTLAYGRYPTYPPYGNHSYLSLITIALDREYFYTYKIIVH